MGFSPEQEKALLVLADREIARPKLIQAREDAEALLAAAQAAEDAAKLGAAEVKP